MNNSQHKKYEKYVIKGSWFSCCLCSRSMKSLDYDCDIVKLAYKLNWRCVDGKLICGDCWNVIRSIEKRKYTESMMLLKRNIYKNKYLFCCICSYKLSSDRKYGLTDIAKQAHNKKWKSSSKFVICKKCYDRIKKERLKRKSTQLSLIKKYMLTMRYIPCCNCGYTFSSVDCENYDVIEQCLDIGWREIGRKFLCTSCVKKENKNENRIHA